MADAPDPEELLDTAVRVHVIESESKVRNGDAVATASSSGGVRRRVQDSTDLNASPSSSPSAAPTFSPTVSPTARPTTLPSASPSVSPSASPSTSPSDSPSVFPSVAPSVPPSSAPSGTPSVELSDVPSFSPSVAPSTIPSVEPSNYPSREHHPSVAPSTIPSSYPSREHHPSVAPSHTSSNSPSLVSLTGQLTASPSASPTALFSHATIWSSVNSPTTASPVISVSAASKPNSSHTALRTIGVILVFIVLLAAYRMRKQKRKKDHDMIIELASQVDPNMMPLVRKTDSGGWKGTYSEEQMQSFQSSPLPDINDGDETPLGHSTPNFPVESTEQQLESIESGVSLHNEPPSSLFRSINSPAGEQTSSDFDTDDDLIRAYEAAMAVDIEPENPDVERAMSGGTGSMAMSGIGSGLDSTNKDLPRIV